MNKERRKRIDAIVGSLRENYDELETIRDEEQDYYDNVPENLACSERAERSQECIDAMDSAIDSLSSAIDDLEGVVDS